jgi:hypothetical protein
MKVDLVATGDRKPTTHSHAHRVDVVAIEVQLVGLLVLAPIEEVDLSDLVG